jgi:hypothetical protein
MKLHGIWSIIVLCASLGLCSCAGASTDERLSNDTAGVLGVSPSPALAAMPHSNGSS